MFDLAVLCAKEPSGLDLRFAALATCLGVDARLIQLSDPLSVDGLTRLVSSQVRGVAMSASTSSFLKERLETPETLFPWLASGGRSLCVYGFGPSVPHEQAAHWLTDGAVAGIVPIPNGDKCFFPASGPGIPRQLSGLTFPRRAQESDCGFALTQEGRPLTTVMGICDRPTFVHVDKSGSSVFLWATKDIASVGQKLSRERELSHFYDSLLPEVIFIRRSFPDVSWENPTPTARVIIDDPLLTNQYGFLNYHELLRSLERFDYGLTVAFIPWNQRRTKENAARLFSANGSRLSLCIHGCDHTNNEFGTMDRQLLQQKASLAATRMVEHQMRTNLLFDKVMVFPQGRFSRASIWALRRSRYVAAVNTTRFLADETDGDLTIADELLPAANCYSGFPIFDRRYPVDRAHFGVDLFLGKPAHIVEHHGFFKHGCEALEACVSVLKAMEPRLEWPTLSSAFRRMHLLKKAKVGDLEIRFFTGTFTFQNPTDRTVLCRFTKREPEPATIKAVYVGDRGVQFQTGNEFIDFQCELGPFENVCIRLEDHGEPATELFNPGIGHRLRTHARRRLSEFRDNHLVRHPRLLSTAKRVVRLLNASS
jgi:hypothetical protein